MIEFLVVLRLAFILVALNVGFSRAIVEKGSFRDLRSFPPGPPVWASYYKLVW